MSKQPWQMTRDEWLAQGTIYETKVPAGFVHSADPTDGSKPIKARTDHLHRFHINRALRAGKPVPQDVYESYNAGELDTPPMGLYSRNV